MNSNFEFALILLFKIALRVHGKDWKKVENYIKTRSGAQIRSHAQKFFMNVQRSHGMDIDNYVKYLQSQEGDGNGNQPPALPGQNPLYESDDGSRGKSKSKMGDSSRIGPFNDDNETNSYQDLQQLQNYRQNVKS